MVENAVAEQGKSAWADIRGFAGKVPDGDRWLIRPPLLGADVVALSQQTGHLRWLAAVETAGSFTGLEPCGGCDSNEPRVPL